jgi:molybdate transport system substrate-binding protein
VSSMVRRFDAAAIMAVVASGVLVGCGSSSSSSPSGTQAAASTSSSSTGGAGAQLTVLAAASLKKVLPKIDSSPKYTFGGSGALATDIEQGAPADVFAAASAKQPAALYAKGLVSKPVRFATNTLVLVVPKDNPAHITSVGDVTKPGVKLVICSTNVPCGDYARGVFKNLGITEAAMKNVVSQTADVSQTVAQVELGQADAGCVYITDAKAANGKVAVVRLPEKAKPGAKDYIAVVKASKKQSAANAYVAAVLSPSGREKLRAAGFGKP